MLWPRFKVFWFCKDSPTGQSERKKKKSWEDNVKETLPAQLGQLRTGKVEALKEINSQTD